MLKHRILTAIVLLLVLVPAMLWRDTRVFAAVTALMVVAGAWEWGRLNGLGVAATRAVPLFMLAALGMAWAWSITQPVPWVRLWQAGALVWTVLAVLLLARGVGRWQLAPRWLRVPVGLALLLLAWLALVHGRERGVNFLLSMLCLVWMADIAAYAGGRALGRRKLAPSISPGKSWEGAVSGAVGVALLAWVWQQADQRLVVDSASLYTQLATLGPALASLALLYLVAMSVAGDLVESLVKRSAGVKDSSGLLPGHGGVLDRVDALLPVLPVAMMLSTY